jgi:hypothetical protein
VTVRLAPRDLTALQAVAEKDGVGLSEAARKVLGEALAALRTPGHLSYLQVLPQRLRQREPKLVPSTQHPFSRSIVPLLTVSGCQAFGYVLHFSCARRDHGMRSTLTRRPVAGFSLKRTLRLTPAVRTASVTLPETLRAAS